MKVLSETGLILSELNDNLVGNVLFSGIAYKVDSVVLAKPVKVTAGGVVKFVESKQSLLFYPVLEVSYFNKFQQTYENAKTVNAKFCKDLSNALQKNKLICETARNASFLFYKNCLDYTFLKNFNNVVINKYQAGYNLSFRKCNNYSFLLLNSYNITNSYNKANFGKYKTCASFNFLVLNSIQTCNLYNKSLNITFKFCEVIEKTKINYSKKCIKYKWQRLLSFNGGSKFDIIDRDDDSKQPDEQKSEPELKIYDKVVYIMNKFKMIDIETGDELLPLSANCHASRDNYLWDFNVNLPFNTNSKYLEFGRVFEIQINSFKWRFMLTEFSKNRVFGKSSIAIKGLSLSKIMSENVSITSYNSATSSQIAQDEINKFQGWELQWDLVGSYGWNLPNGFNTTGSSLQNIRQLVDAAGGEIYTDMYQKLIKIRNRFDKTKLDKVVSESLVTSLSSEFSKGENFEQVLIASNNLIALVRKENTVIGKQADLIKNELVADIDAARSLGYKTLTESCDKNIVTVETKLHEDIGVLEPSMYIQIKNNKCLVDDVSINASWQNGISVKQTCSLTEYLKG